MMGQKAGLWSFLVLKGEIAIECKLGFVTDFVCYTTDISATVIYYTVKGSYVRFSALACLLPLSNELGMAIFF